MGENDFSFSYSYGTYDAFSGFNSIGGSGYAGQNVTYQGTNATGFDAFTSNPFVTNTTTTGFTLDASVVGSANYQIGVDYTNNAVTGFANPNTGGTQALSLDNTYYTISSGSDKYLTSQFNAAGSIAEIQTLTATVIANTQGVDGTYSIIDTIDETILTRADDGVSLAVPLSVNQFNVQIKTAESTTVADSTATGLTTAEQTRAINDLESLVEELVTRDPNLNTRAGVELAAATADEARKLLETNGNGLGLLPDYRAGLESVVNRAANYADFAQGTLQAANLTLESIKATALTDSTTTQWSKTTSQQAQAYIDSLPANQLAIINAAGLGQQFVDIIILGEGISPFSNYKYLTPTPYNVEDTTFRATPIQSIIDNLTAAYIAQNGAISEEQYQSIVALVETQNSINVQRTETLESVVENRKSIFNVVAGAESTTDTNLPALDQGDTAIQTIEVTANTSLSKAIRESLGIDYQGPIVEKLIDRAINLGLNQIPGYSQVSGAIGTANKVVKLGDIVTNVDLSPAETALALARLFIPQVNLLVNGYNLLNGGDGFLGAGGGGAGAEAVDPTPVSPAVDPQAGGGGGLGEALFADANLVDVAPVGNFAADYNVETGTYDVIDLDTGEIAFSGLSRDTAIKVADALSAGDNGTALDIIAEAENDAQLNTGPDDVTLDNDPNLYPNGPPYDDNGNLNPGWAINPETGEPYYTGIFGGTGEFENVNSQESITLAKTKLAQNQAAIEAQRKQANEGDWRVKLRLAGGADYLYKDPGISSDGILYPLAVTDGVIFPYTPVINTTYGANYSTYDLTHSNYRGHFYQNSYVDDIQLQATFTAQDTNEANYMLAVIHFFRSVTKMFYGQDAQRGTPPPMVFLQGLGEFQFNLHPCVVKSFTYNLPGDVDYIRARTVQINGTNLLQKRDRQTLATSSSFSSLIRLANAGVAGLQPGALTSTPPPPTLGTNNPTYVPTKIDISLVLLPIQTRSQVSKQFSLKSFANGDLLKGGFW